MKADICVEFDIGNENNEKSNDDEGEDENSEESEDK